MRCSGRKQLLCFFGAVLLAASMVAVAPAAGQAGLEVSDRSDGGVDVKFRSGCWIRYDSQGARGGHVGSCSSYEYSAADRAASDYLRGSASGTSSSIEDRGDGGAMVTYPSGCRIVYDRYANRGGHSGQCSQYEYNRADNEAARYLSGGSARIGSDGAGVRLYRDHNFGGSSETINQDIADMKYSRIGNDSLSSIRVPQGCRVVLYVDHNFRGNSVVLESDAAELGRTRVGNDSVSSIAVACGQGGGYDNARQGVPQGQMQRYCQGEASGALSVRPTDISTARVERISGGRFSVRGQTPQSGSNVTRFECTFDANGVFEQVLVTDRPNNYDNSANRQPNQAQIPQAARARCLSTFGGGASSRVTSVSALRPGFWEVIMRNDANGRSVACTVTDRGEIENWVELN